MGSGGIEGIEGIEGGIGQFYYDGMGRDEWVLPMPIEGSTVLYMRRTELS